MAEGIKLSELMGDRDEWDAPSIARDAIKRGLNLDDDSAKKEGSSDIAQDLLDITNLAFIEDDAFSRWLGSLTGVEAVSLYAHLETIADTLHQRAQSSMLILGRVREQFRGVSNFGLDRDRTERVADTLES